MASARQLALPFPHRPEFAVSAFLRAPSNAGALIWLDRMAEWPGRRLALWGEAGCGKSHLLHIWAARAGGRVVPGASLGLGAISEMAVPLALDDAELAPEEPVLLHVLNAAAETGAPVLLAARVPPARWPVRLPDLVSRLRAITAVEIGPAEDTLLQALLASLLAERQLAVTAVVQDWLRVRLPRTPAAMREAAARLDKAGFAAGRAVTRAVAAAVLAEMTATEAQ